MASSSSAQLKEDTTQPSQTKKRKVTKQISFEVVRVCEDARKGKYILKMMKPVSNIDINDCPTVCLKGEQFDDKHAFHIMHNIYHKNILKLKALDKNKMKDNDPLTVAAFVEPYDGKLLSICKENQCADNSCHIPSPELRRYLREIASGIDFLIKNDLYHGNLSWDSTLYHGTTVKLAGFKMKESMNLEEAKWGDWTCFIKMLEDILEKVQLMNTTLSRSSNFFCGTLESLIAMMKKLDSTSLLRVKEIIFRDLFFWDLTDRVNFFARTVSLKLSDLGFMNKVKDSNLCETPWDKKCTTAFKGLVQQMNDHRESERKKAEKNSRRWGQGAARGGNKMLPYNGNSIEDYVRCICGAYTHRTQMQINVDQVVRENHPTIFIGMIRIMDTADD